MSNGLINRQYVGARYVPKIMGEWNKALQYEALCIVTYMGNSFTSKVPVPPNIDITNTDYWINTGNYNAQIEEYKKEVNTLADNIKKYESFVTPEMFGAIGDSVNDDTNAIQDAINIGNVVFKRNKTYKITKPLNIGGSRTIDLNNATILSTGTAIVINKKHASNPVTNVIIKNGYIESYSNGLEIYDSYFITLEHLKIYLKNNNTNGIYFENGFNNSVIHCYINGSNKEDTNGIYYNTNADSTIDGITNVTNTLIDSCLIQRLHYGILINGVSNTVYDTNMITNTSFSFCNTGIITTGRNINNLIFINGRCESSNLFIDNCAYAYINLSNIVLQTLNNGISNAGYISISDNIIIRGTEENITKLFYANTGEIYFEKICRVVGVNYGHGEFTNSTIISNTFKNFITFSSFNPMFINCCYTGNTSLNIDNIKAPNGAQMYLLQREGDKRWVLGTDTYTEVGKIIHLMRTDNKWFIVN